MEVDNPCTDDTRRTEKGLLPIEFGRNKIKSTSIENIIRKSYNLMEKFNLIPENLNDLSEHQVKNWFKKISDTLVGGTTLGRFFHPEQLCQITPSYQYILVASSGTGLFVTRIYVNKDCGRFLFKNYRRKTIPQSEWFLFNI